MNSKRILAGLAGLTLGTLSLGACDIPTGTFGPIQANPIDIGEPATVENAAPVPTSPPAKKGPNFTDMGCQLVNRGPGTYAISEDARGNLCIFLPDGRHVSAISWGTVSR